MLNEPLQWQILKARGVLPREVDAYTLRKFKRGHDIEAWFCGVIEPITEQQDVEYRDVNGRMDCLVDTSKWDFPRGIVPLEVKSVSNAKYKRLTKAGKPDQGHLLQACLYALAKETDHFGIAYIASDDLRVSVSLHETKDYQPAIDGIIDRFNQQLATGRVPVFEPVEAWQANAQYCKYPDWVGLSAEEIEQKLISMGNV